MAGLGGGFDGDQGAFNPSPRTGSATGGLPRDFFVTSDASPFMSGAGSSSYPNPQLGFDHLALNDGQAWTRGDFDQYAVQLRGDEDVMPPPVRVPSGGSNRRMNFRPPRHSSVSGGSGDEGFVAPVARPPRASTIGSTGRTARGQRLRRLGAVNEEQHTNASAEKVVKSKANWTAENVEKYCNCYLSEMHIGNYPGGAMNKYGWKGLAQRYYAATGLMHDREQLQGKQRTLKKMWKFCNVARSSTGLAIDEDGFIQASDKWWKDNATEPEFMRVRTTGLPPYLPQMDEMFQGNTVDGTTSFVPAATQRTELNVVSSDEEGAQEQDTLTPMSFGTKRPSSTSTTASSPNKKSKSPAVRAMNMHMTSHLQMARERLEFQKEMHKENKLALENLRLGVSWKIAECTRIAEKDMGISAATPTLLDGLIKMAKSEPDMDMFLSTTSEPVRMRILENLALKTGSVDN